jgi:Pyruvate/2-oxoacid:ferredoxin oxidoreductase delta subunit
LSISTAKANAHQSSLVPQRVHWLHGKRPPHWGKSRNGADQRQHQRSQHCQGWCPEQNVRARPSELSVN